MKREGKISSLGLCGCNRGEYKWGNKLEILYSIPFQREKEEKNENNVASQFNSLQPETSVIQ